MEFIQQFINGLNLGSIYALMALGYTMVYGIAKMLNFAHGDIIMVGAYTISVGATMFGLSPVSYTHLDVYKRQSLQHLSVWKFRMIECKKRISIF